MESQSAFHCNFNITNFQVIYEPACSPSFQLTDAVMHMYTHDKLWPEMSDLAASLGSKCNIIDADSGGNCFDEAASTPWARLAEKFPSFPIPMACQSCTVELRGEADVRIHMTCLFL